jgi:hypothetical protein
MRYQYTLPVPEENSESVYQLRVLGEQVPLRDRFQADFFSLPEKHCQTKENV